MNKEMIEMKSYGSDVSNQMEGSEHAQVLNPPSPKLRDNWKNSEIGLLFLSPGFPFVVVYILVAWYVSTLVPLNMRYIQSLLKSSTILSLDQCF
jgi:hypothetical protein